MSDARPPGMRIDPRARQHTFAEIGQEIIYTVILSLSLIQIG